MSRDDGVPVVVDAANEDGAPRSRPDPVPLGVLTDEELSALSPVEDRLVATPYLDEVEPASRQAVLLTAVRSLRARGLIQVASEASTGERVGFEIDADLGLCLDLRAQARTLLAIRRTTRGPQLHLRYVHVVADMALVEDVDAAGLHCFHLTTTSDLAPLLEVYLVPRGSARGHGAPGPGEILDLAAAAHVVADLAVVRVGEPVDALRQLYAGPGGCWTDVPGLPESGLRLTPIDPDAIGAWAAGLVDRDGAPVGTRGSDCGMPADGSCAATSPDRMESCNATS